MLRYQRWLVKIYMSVIKKIFKDNFGLILTSGIILIALMIIYSDTLDGSKSFYGANDKISAINVKEAIVKSDDYPYWFPWMMGGIPSVHSAQNISDYYPPNYIMKMLHSMGVPWFWNYIFHFLFAGIGMYLLCSRLRLNSFASTLSALGFAITPYMTGMLVHGHGSQVMTLCYMPWVFYAYIKLKNRPSIKRLSLLSLFLALQLLRGHVQMAYYTWLMLGILILIDIFYNFIVKKEKKFKWIFYTISGLLLGFVSSLSLYIPMLSYTPFSARSSSDRQGAGLDYVTEYSFSFGEIATFFIPSYYGFGEATYWGTMTFTSFPHYMSVIMLMFAIYGVIRYQWTIFKVFSMLCIVFFLTLSFGKNFIGFYTFFYDYLPFFSKLRNPAYLLIIVQFCTMILAGMGGSMILKDIKARKIILPIYSICSIGLLCLSPFIVDFNLYAEKEYAKEDAKQVLLDNERIKTYKTQILYLENKKNKEFKDIDSKATGKNFTREEIVSFKNGIGKDYDLKIGGIQKDIDALSLLSKKLALTKSLIDTDTWFMQVFIFFIFIGVIGFYYGYPFISNYKYLSYIFIFFIMAIVFLDFYFVNRKITNRENPEYLLSEDAQLKYKDYYNTLHPFTRRDLIAPLVKARQNYSDTTNTIQKLIDKKNKGEIFRVLDQDGGSGSNVWSRYHIEDVSGYHPAKLKSYKKFFESEKGLSKYILAMMNVKYILIDEQITLSEDLGIYPEDRAYFVNKIEVNNGDNKEERFMSLYLSDKKPSDVSYITSSSEINHAPSGDFIIKDKDVIDSINNSNPNELIIKVNTSGPQFLVVSEIFYPNGWKATLNGKETIIYEVNDLIRGISIDKAGEHSIRMWFDPTDLKWGRALSYIGFFTILIFIFFGYIQSAWTYSYSKLKK